MCRDPHPPRPPHCSPACQTLNTLRRGDAVITQGGIFAKVTRVKEDSDELELEIAEGVKVRVVRSTIATVVSKTEPAKDA